MKHKQTLRRGLGILLSLVLCLSLLPATALAEEPASKTADFTENTAEALALLTTGDSEGTPGTTKAEWDSTNKILTLSGVDFTTSAYKAVVLPDGATIVLAAGTENTITSTSQGKEEDHSSAIFAEGGLTITGEGQLTATGGTANFDSCGIFAYASRDTEGSLIGGSITISGGTVEAKGGAVKAGGRRGYLFELRHLFRRWRRVHLRQKYESHRHRRHGGP